MADVVMEGDGRQNEAVIEPSEQIEAEQKLVWDEQWYPVAIIADLDPKRPVPIHLLGKSLVIWADAEGKWHCLEDRCPHR